MAKKKIQTVALDDIKKKLGLTNVRQAELSAPAAIGSKAATGAKASAPVSASEGFFKSQLAQARRYAALGSKQTAEVANALAANSITNPGKNALNSWSDAAARQATIDNVRMAQSLGNLFNSEKYALNPQTSFLSELPYLKKLQELKQKDLEKSIAQDDYVKSSRDALSTKDNWLQSQYQKLEKNKNSSDPVQQLQDWTYFDWLSGDRAEPYDFGAIMKGTNGMSDEEYEAWENRLKTQYSNADWKTLTNQAVRQYESKTDLLQAQLDLLGKTIGNKSTISELAQVAKSNPDYANLSKYTGAKLKMGENEDNMFSSPWFYINNAGAEDFNQAAYKTRVNYATQQVENYQSPYLDLGYEYMTPEEVAVYNTLYSTDKEQASAYLEALGSDLLQRRALTNQNFWSTLASENGTAGLAWLLARGSGVMNVEDKLLQTVAAIKGDNDANAAYYDEENMKKAVDSAINKNIGDVEWLKKYMIGDQNIGQHLFNAGTGLVDSVIPMAVDALMGGTGKLNQALMAGQAYSSGLQESAERDLSAGQTLLTGGVNALAGWLSEKIGPDPGVLTGKSNFLRNAVSEGAEELLENLGTTAADDVMSEIFGTQSNYDAEVAALRLAGDKNPELTAITNKLGEMVTDFAYGAFAGGMMGVPGQIAEYADNRATGKAVQQKGDPEKILEIAKSMPATSEARDIAMDIAGMLDKNGKLSIGKLGKLTKALSNELSQEYADITNKVLDDAIESRLVEVGSTPEAAKKNAAAIRKMAYGEKLTAAERVAVAWDAPAEQVTKELTREMRETKTTVEGAPAAAPEGLRTGQRWLTEAKLSQMEATGETLGKQMQLRSAATSRDVSNTVKNAVAKGAAKTRRGKAAGKMTDRRIVHRDGTGKAEGNVLRFEDQDGTLKMVVEIEKDGKKAETHVDLDSMVEAYGSGTAGIIEAVHDINETLHPVTAEEASAMLSTYAAAGGDANAFVQDYERAYLAGYSGMETKQQLTMDPALAQIARNAGAKQAEADEGKRKQRASAYKAVSNPVSGWLGRVNSNSDVKGRGDAEALPGALEAMTESQRMTAEAAVELGKAVGLNVVLYESGGKNMGGIANGSFDEASHTVYLDINAGLGSAQDIRAQKDAGTLGYAIMRTMGHELTHYLEVASPEMYAKYKTAVTNALKEAGQDMAVLIREKIDRALAQGKKLTYNGAVAEVIADASEYMLQDSKFTTRLDNTLRGKVKTFVQNFMGKVKEIFSNLTSAHRESKALREMVDGIYRYTGQLQELWDASLQEVMDKGTVEQTEVKADEAAQEGNPLEDLQPVRQFSMGRDVEVREDGLIAMHNLKESDVYGTLGLGGFPMPSIAIVKAKHGHSMYGEYSVIFGKETIDPKGNARNKVYGDDAWTPVFPVVETEVLDDVILAKNVIQQVQTIPTSYFEAKPARVVGFDEVKMLVAPDTMQQDLANKLDEAGIPYTTYDGTEADRLAKVNAVEDVQFSLRDGQLLTPLENKRVESAWIDYTVRGYKFFERNNGGIIVDLDSVIVYTDDEGIPEYVLEVGTDDRWSNNDVYNKVVEMEREGISHEVQHRILESLFGTKGAHFRTRGKRSRSGGKNRKGAGRNAREMGSGDHREVSDEVNQYSLRDLPADVTVRDYLRELKPTSRMNETEKILLKRYQEQLKMLEEKERLVEELEEIIRTAPFRNPDGSLNDEITKAKNRYKIYRDQANRAARALTAYERDDGFAGILATGQQVVNELQLGSAGGIADAADVLESEVAELTAKLKKLEADVTRTATGQRNAYARGLYDPKKLNAAAQQLKESYGSRMSVKNIADRLALTFGELYANDGAEGARLFIAAAKDLAIDLLKSNKFRYKSEILPMLREKIGTISLSETDVQEIENRGYTLREYKAMLSPYIKVTEGGSDLSSYASNAQYYADGALAAILQDDAEGNLAMRLYEVISREKARKAEITYEGMTESQLIGMAMADIAGADLPVSANNQTVEYLRKELMKYAGESAEVAIAVEEAIGKAKTTTAKASNVWREAVKHTETAREAVEYYRKLEEQRRVMELAEQKKSLTEQLKSDNAQKLKEKIEEKRAEFREREQRAREYRKAREDVDKIRRRISRNVKTVNTLRLRETDQKHVPQELQHVANLLMQTFADSELGRLAFPQEKMNSLSHRYRLLKDLESDATHFWDDEIEAELDNLQQLGEAYSALKHKEGGVPSRFSVEGVQLETEILQGVDNIVSNVLNMIDGVNDAFLSQRNETFGEFAKKTGEKLQAHKDHKVLKGLPGKIQEMLDENLRTGNTTPIYFFEHLQNEELLDVFHELRQGQNYYAQIVAEGKDFVQKAKAEHNYGAWVNDGKLKMKTGQGHMIELTREEAAEIYAIAKREQANKLYQTEHLLYGGFQYKNIAEKVYEDGKTRAKNDPHQLDKADIAKIGEWLTDEQKAYADKLVGFLSTTMADYGNAASMDMYGYKKFTEQYYIPFHTVADQRFQRGDEGPQGENAGTGRVKNSGFTKKLQHKANQPLLVGGLTDTVADHIHKMAAYSAMVQPIENMKRLLNHKVLENDGTVNTVRALIGQKYGQAVEDYLTQLLKDANGATMTDQRASNLTDKLVGAFKRGAVMASASVVLQQPTAAARAMAYISPKYFAQNPFYRPSKGTWDEMMKYSGTAVIKDMGKFDVGMGLTASQYITDENLGVAEAYRRLKDVSKTKAGKAAYDRFMAWLTAAPGAADQWTWGLIWKANKAKQAELHPEMDKSSEAFLQLCGDTFDDVIDHTQVYDSVLTRSNLMRSTNALHKMATSFMSEPTLSLNMIYDALTGRHGGKQRATIIGGVVASQVLAGALAALVQVWNDDDDERNWLEKYADRATGNIIDNIFVLNMIPYVSDIVSLFQGYDVERPDMSVIADIYDYSKTFFKAFENGGTPSWKQIENFAGTLANLVGVPAKNISREIRRTRNAILNTDWSAPDAFNVRQAMLENAWGYGESKTEYYQRITTALIRGETELAEDYKAYMLASKGADADTLKQGIREAYKKAYQRGGIDKEQAFEFLLDNDLVTGDTEDKRRQSAFQYVDKWGEGTTNYSAYNTLKAAYGEISFANIEKAWKELTNHGYSNEQVKTQSRTLIRQLVEDGTLNPGQATQLLKKWCPYKKDSDNTDKPKEWLSKKE